MPNPPEIRTSLLSGYLDGILSPEERREAERLLQTDREAAAYLDALRSMRDAIHELGQDPRPRLGDDFSTRVIEAAVARARAEGVADEHPLARIAEQPTGSGGPAGGGWFAGGPWTTGGRFRLPLRLSVGLAASILIAAFLIRGWVVGPQTPRVAEQAHTDPGQAHTDPEQTRSPVPTRPGPNETPGETESRGQAEIARNSDGFGETESSGAREDRRSPAIIVPTPDSPPRMAFDPTPSGPAGLDRDVSIPEVPPLAAEATAAAGGALNAILALEVRQTADGRARKVLRNAIRQAGLEAARPQAGLVDAAKETLSESEDDDAERISVVYLKGPAKTLDRLIMALVTDRQGVESIGWNLVLDPPVLQAVAAAIPPDPRAVRHESPLWIPIDGAEEWVTITETLGDRDFLPWDESGGSPLGLSRTPTPGESPASGDESGPDVPAEILLLVRP